MICAVLLFCTSMPVTALYSEKKVRVGVFSLGQFNILSTADDGTLSVSGYNADFLEQISLKTHWKIEYVSCANWVEATEMLESEEIDLLAPAQITDSLKEKFDYAALYMGSESAAIYTNADSEVNFQDFRQMNGLVYGCAEGSTFARKFESEYCPENGLSPQIKYYANTTELQTALANGEVDAIVTNIMFASEKYKMLDWFLVLPIYYITQKGNTELLTELDNAMRSLLVEQPTLISDLENTYSPIYGTTHITSAETDYIKALPVISIGYEQEHKPLSYTDENGEFCGITRSVLDRISEITGIRFNYLALPSSDVTWAYLRENNICVLSNVEYNDANLAVKAMSLSEPYLLSEKVLVAKSDMSFSPENALSIGVPTGSGTLAAVIRESYPNLSVTEYPTVEECFDAVESGKLDGTMVNRYIADCSLGNPAYSDMAVIPIQSLGDKLCIAALNFGDDSELSALVNDKTFLSVINKAISQISTDELNAIIITNTSAARYESTFTDMMRAYRGQIAVFLLLIMLVVILMIIITVNRQHNALKLTAANRELELAVARADSANAAKSQFLAQMSHEIRTPMNAIIGLTSIAGTETDRPERVKDDLDKIEGRSRLLLEIINNILDMSAIEGGKLKIDKASFNFKQMLTNITAIFYQQTKIKGIRLEVRMNGVTEETVIGDELRVNQILMNLLSNAVKFTPAGGEIDLIVIQASRSLDKVQMRFSVSDTGCGMSEEMMGRLFKPFEQEYAATARKHGGSGLGLSITKNLAQMMGGSVSVQSTLGKGSVFTVDIPFGVQEESHPADTTGFADIRTLVVDDDRESCEYSGILLERLGVRYDYVTTGEAALEALGTAEDNGDPYSLCLIDWKMPDMDGIEVTRKIREIFGDDTIVIIVSAYDLNEVETSAKASGANYFIPKPLFQSTLFNAMMRISGGDYTKIDAKKDKDNYDFKGRRVLVAEDVALNLEVAVKLLKMVGISVTCAEDGRQAAELFRKSAPGE